MPHVPGLPRTDGRQRRWDAHNAERRRAVLRAAVELLEEQPPGAELHVQQIAERAGLVRTVVYRLFNNRADLNRTVQRHVVALLHEQVEPHVALTGTPTEVVGNVIGAYVGWVAAHPHLHDFAGRELGDGQPNELDRALGTISARISELVKHGAGVLLGAEVDDDQAATADLLVTGLVGQVRGTVDQWVRNPDRTFSRSVLTRLLTQWTWFQIEGQARVLGLEVHAMMSLDDLVGPS